MAFTTKVITDTSPDFGDNPQIVTENDRPASVEVDGLVANTGYWTKAEIWQNGVLNDTSEVETFTTLPAGTITLEHISTTRSGYGYDVTYRYTSTYAPSSAILSTNGTQFQGFIDSGQNAISFLVTGLTAGTAYLTNVTLYDIYTESATVTGSIVATVVNEVRITDTTPAQTSVECELDYVIDSGFTTGWVDYWMGADDPATDQPQGHFYFNDGDETCTVSGLTAGTAYYFRATIVLGDGTTEVRSSVVSASTTAALGEYFTITNLTNETAEFSVAVNGTVSNKDLNYSVDGGSTWTAYDFTTLPTVNVAANGNIKFKGTNSGGIGTSVFNDFSIGFHLNKRYSISGNPSSMVNPDPAVFSTYTDAAHLGRVFMNEANLVDASGLETSQYTRVRDFVFYRAFEGSGLQRPPRLNNVTIVYRSGMERAFYGCSALAEATDLSSLVELRGEHALLYTYRNCTSLTIGSNLHKLTTISNNGGMVEGTYEGCTSLVTVYSPKLSTWNETYFRNWLNGVSASGEVCVPTGMSLNVIPTDTVNGVPNGWWAHFC